MNDIINQARKSSVGIYLESKKRLTPEPVNSYEVEAQNELEKVQQLNKSRQVAQAQEATKLSDSLLTPKDAAPKEPTEQAVLGYSGFTPDNEDANNIKREYRTEGEYLGDISNAFASGGQRAYGSIVNTATLGAYGLRKIEQAFGGRDIVELQQALDQADEMTRVTATQNWLQNKKSQVSKDATKELEAIRNDTSLSADEQFAKTSAFYARNPTMAGIGVIESAVGSYLEMAATGGVGKAAGLSTKAAINTGMFLSGANAYVQAAQADGTATDKTIGYGAVAGVGTALLGIGAKKLVGGTDVDSLGVNGLMSGKQGLANYGRGIVQEATEEVPQNVGSGALNKFENDEDIYEELGINAAEGLYLGMGSAAFTNAPSAIGAGAKAGVESANTKLAERDVKKFGTAEENIDPTSEKFNPSRGVKNAIYDLRSSSPEVRKAAGEVLAGATSNTYAEFAKINQEIADTSNETTKAALIAKRDKFEAEHLQPLKAEVETYMNVSKANKDNFMLVLGQYAEDKAARKAELENSLVVSEEEAQSNLDSATAERLKNVDPAEYNIDMSELGQSTNSNSESNTTSSSNSLAGIIQAGESGAAEHSAVNYGKGKAKGNIDPTKMTLGQIADGLKNGDFVAVGKYQFHRSSFPDIFNKGNVTGINRDTIFSPEIQDKIFAEYYVGKKRGDLGRYIRGENVSVEQANDALASEWQAAKGSKGQGLLGHGATIESKTIQAGLKQSRAIYAQMVKDGKSPEVAMRAAVLFSLDGAAPQTKAPTENVNKTNKNIVYANQDAKRNEPLKLSLTNVMSTVMQPLGVTMKVHSGGQSETSNGKVGSNRHDHGGAADADFYIDGGKTKLSFNNPEHRTILATIIEEAAAKGVQGIGGDIEYMGDGRLHIGFGNSATWGGKGGKSSAPQWIRDAHARGVAKAGNADITGGSNAVAESSDETSTPTSQTKSSVPQGNQSVANAAEITRNENLYAGSDTTNSEQAVSNETSDTEQREELPSGQIEVNNTDSDTDTETPSETEAKADTKSNVETGTDTTRNKDSEPLSEEDVAYEEYAMQQTRAFFSSMSEEEIDAHPLLKPEQKIALKQLSAFKRKLASEQTTDSVRKQIIEGFEGDTNQESNLGLKQYDTVLNQAIASNDKGTAATYLGYLKRFADNSVAKSNAIEQALVDGATKANPIFIGADTKGAWQQITAEQYAEAGNNNTSVYKVSQANKGTKSIKEEGEFLTEALNTYTASTQALLGKGLAPITPSQAPVATSQSNSSKSSSEEVKQPVPPESEQSDGDKNSDKTGFKALTRVENYSEVPTDAEYLGRATVEGKTTSMGNIKSAEDIGNPGWLGNPHNEATPAKGMEKYIGSLKANAAKYPEFVQALIETKGKALYGNTKASKRGEVGLLTEMLPQLPNNYRDALDYINRIESYNPDTGIKLLDEAPTPPKAEEPAAPVRTRYDVDAVKERSAIPDPIGKSNAKSKGKAVNPVSTTNARTEISVNTAQETDTYVNSYSGNNGQGVASTVSIKRDKKTNKLIEVTYAIEGGKQAKTFTLKDKTVSDELLMSKLEKKLGAEEEFVQINLNNQDEETTQEYGGRVIPKELVNKTVNLEEAMKLYADDIEAEAVEPQERALHKGLINTLLNFNPEMKVLISEGTEENDFDRSTNTIKTNLPMTEGSILQEIARAVVGSTTGKIAGELELLGSTDMVVDLNKLYDLNQDLSKLRHHVDSIIRAEFTKGRFNTYSDGTEISGDSKAKIIKAMSSNAKLFEMATTDMDIVKFLQGIEVPKTKVKQSIFAKIVSSLKSFLNIGSNNQINNQFDKLLELTVRAASEQSRNLSVDFKASDDAKVHIFRGMDSNSLEIAQQVELKKNFYERNQLLAVFKQSAAKGKPLTRIANLTDKLKLDLMQGLQSLVSEAPTKVQREQIEDFLVFRDEMAEHILQTFRKKQPAHLKDKEGNPILDDEGNLTYSPTDFGFQDLKTYFMDNNGDIDNNVVTSVALAAYDWVVENGNKTQNMDKDIKKLLNLDPDDIAFLSPEVKELYQFRGGLRPYATAKIGKKAVEVLGIKATENASAEAQSRLENSIGEWAISAMQSADLVHITSISSEQHKANIEEVGGDLTNFSTVDNGLGQVSFLSVTNPEGLDVNPRLHEVFMKNKGTVGYMGEVFGTEIGLRAPLKSAPTKTIDKIKRTISTMSLDQRKYVEKMQAEPISINVDMSNGLQGLLASDRDTTLEMIGASVTDETLASKHKNERHSLESAAEGVFRDLENGLDFINSLPKLANNKLQEFYDYVYAAKNNRMHYASNMFNFQSSKLQRSLGEYSNFENTLDISVIADNNIAVLDENNQVTGAAYFIRAVAESAEGTEDIIKAKLEGKNFVDGFTVDKIDSINFIDPFYQYLRSDVDVQTAVKATTKLLGGNKLTSAEVKSIAKVVKFWEGEANSLRALIEYTKFQNAIDNGDTEFTTSLGLGSDGINNGSAISYMQMGVGNDKFFTQVGMLPEDGVFGGMSNYFQTRTNPEIGDYYTGFEPHIKKAFGELTDKQAAILELNTNFFKRKSFKAVLIPFGYSAGMPRLKALVYGQFMSDIMGQLVKVGNMDATTQEAKDARQALENKLNRVLTTPVTLPEGKALLEFWFEFRQENELKKAYESEIGDGVVEALEAYAAPFMEARDRNVKMQNAAYDTYNTLKNIIKEETNKTYKEYLAKQDRYKDLTDAQLTKLIKVEGIPKAYYDKHIKHRYDAIRPTVKTPFNKDSTDWFDDSDFSIPQQVNTLKADPTSQSNTWKVNTKQEYVGSTVSVPKSVTEEESSGVMVNSAQVQGTDAKISARASAFGGNVNINVHDANISGLLNYIKMGLEQNKTTYESLRDYHAQSYSLLALSETVGHALNMYKDGTLSEEVLTDILFNAINDIYGNDAIVEYQEANKIAEELSDADMLDKMVKPFIAKLLEDTKATENAKLDNLSRIGVMHQYGGEGAEYVVTAADKAEIEVQRKEIDKLYKDIAENMGNALNTVKNKNTEEPSDSNTTEETPQVFKPISEAITSVENMIADPSNNITEQKANLFNYVKARIKAHEKESGRVIRTAVTDKLNKGERGRFDVATSTIFMSKDYLKNGNPDQQLELLLHEMMHALTAVTVATSKDADVRKAVGTLETMRKQLQTKAKKEGNKYYANVVFASIDEFVAYGMTDTAVMQYMNDTFNSEVSNTPTIKFSSRVKSGALKFLKSVFTLFGGKSTEYENFLRSVDVITASYSDAQLSDYNGAVSMYSTAPSGTDALRQLSSLNVSTEHNNHLNSIIDTTITQFLEVNTAKTDLIDKVINKVNTKAINAGFKMSDKELHVNEIVKEIAKTFLTENSGTKAASDVRAAYTRASKEVTVDMFLDDPSTATPAERKQAQKQHAHLFKANNPEPVERFFALTISSEEVQKVMAKLDNIKTTKEETTWFGKLMEFFTNMMRWLSGRALNTNGLNMPTELDVLFERLGNINKSAKSNHVNMFDKGYAFTTKLVTVPANFVVSKLMDAIFGVFNFGAASSNPTIRAASSAIVGMRETGIGAVADNYLGLQTRATTNDASGRLNGLGEIIYEMGRNKGMKQVVESLIRMTTKANQTRQTTASKAKDALIKVFTNIDKVPKSQLDAVTQGALRTDASALMRHGTSITQVIGLLKDTGKHKKMITKLEAQIATHPYSNDVLLQTKALGHYMATEVAPEHLVKNAEGIAIGKGSWYETDIANMDTALRDTIDQLASLYAMEATSKEAQSQLNTLIAEQPEAIKALLNHHLEMVNRSMEDFKGNMPNYSKGYMPQKTNDLRSLKFAEDDLEVTKLEAQGWEKVSDGDIRQDISDNTDGRTLMFHNDMLYRDYVSGALDMKDTHAKGTMVYNVAVDLAEVNRVNAEKIASRRRRSQTNHKQFNFSKQAEGNLIASYNAEGELTGYHYEMSGRLRDTYLERDNNAIELLGRYHSNLAFKPEVAKVQRTIAQELYQDFKDSYGNDPRQFVTLDPESKDPNVVMMWRMMPYEFRAEASKLFGKGMPIVVRSTVYNTVFGFRTYSMSEMFDKVTGEKNMLEVFLTGVLQAIFGDKAQMRTLQGERLWQQGISQIKDFIVIRNYKVLVGNIVSNALLLSLQGVSPTQQIKDFISVWNNGGKYRDLAARVVEIDSEIAINRNRPKEISRLKRERNLAMIEMERNPLHDFMEEGLMSSIVEDTDLYAEDNGYKSELDKKIDEYAGNIPKQVVTAFNWALMSPGTPMHNFMAHSTQFSDLAAKYSLTKHRMSKGDSKADAIAEAQDAFINYDIPTGKGLDYLNKMGLFMFTKFVLRFQQAIMKQLSTRAGSAISQHLMVEELTNQAGVLEPFMLNRLGNPLSAGMLNYGSAFNNISTVSFMKGLID